MKPLEIREEFIFGCGPDIICFNDCCQDLNQFLTPYDILCMKKSLGMTSRQFLEQYISFTIGPKTGLPIASLSTDNSLVCPFVTKQGCRIYEHRPASCRSYPLARMAGRDADTKEMTEKYFLIKELHCRGHGRGRAWTADKWVKNQGLLPYNQANDLFMDVIIEKSRKGSARLSQKDSNAFILACYDSDGFREAIDKRDETLLGRNIPEMEKGLDDKGLMALAFKWILQRLSAL